jgi:uncharacterized protein YndB with AHSA1/START domain
MMSRADALDAPYPRRTGGESDGLTLTVKRDFPAARALLVGAFVDPNQFAEWFGPKGYSVARVEFIPRVGERYRIEMQPPDGHHFHVTGEVCEVDLPRRLAFTFVYEEPHADDVETQVSLSFRDLGESTEVDLTQGPFKTAARRALHQEGWSDSFDKLERFISTQA